MRVEKRIEEERKKKTNMMETVVKKESKKKRKSKRNMNLKRMKVMNMRRRMGKKMTIMVEKVKE